MSTLEGDGLNVEELRLAQEQAHTHWLPINFGLEMRGFTAPGEQKGQSRAIALR